MIYLLLFVAVTIDECETCRSLFILVHSLKRHKKCLLFTGRISVVWKKMADTPRHEKGANLRT